MKLFTEEQVKHAIHMARASQNLFTTPFIYDKYEILEQLAPIEIPSDEEIQKESKFKSNHNNPQAVQFNPALNIVWVEGAKSMRDKIEGGNK
jgi:hypothetical protein